MFKSKIVVLFLVLMIAGFSLNAVTNYWDGSVNYYWHNDGNWSLGHIPLATEDVVIPAGVPRFPAVGYYDDECNNLTINSGASLTIHGYTLTVNGDMTNFGELEMTNSSGVLNVGNDISWESGSSENITAGTINVAVDWYFKNGTNCTLGTENTVFFDGSERSDIFCFDSDAEFGNLVIDKSSGVYTYIGYESNQPTRVAGDMTVQSGKFNIFTGILIVDGILDVQSGTVLTMTLSGILENNSDFTLNGEFDVNYGYVTINGSFEIASTGSLLIGSGTFISEGGATYNQIYGNLELSSGLYHAKDQIRIKSSATTNISGGTIRSQGFVAQYAGNFQPSGGTVEIQTEDYIYGGLLCNNGNYFHNLEINPTTGNGATLSSDIVIQNDFEITSGQFLINSYEVTVGHDVEIFGYIGMTNSAAILSAGDDINWRSGSSENITAGHIYAEGWAFEDGTNAQLGTGNTVHVDGNITIGDDDAEFGNLEMGSFSRIESRGNRDGVAIRVAGYCTVKTGTSMISNLDFIVEGTMDIEDGATLLMYNSCTLTSDSDFTLNGHLDLTTTGNALVHGEFDFNSSGTLTINGGTFIWDAPYSRTRNILGGNLNLSWGLFEITNNPLILGSTFNSNISGGTIRVGYWFYAYSSSTFQPSGGILEMSDGHAGGNITCYGGNYFHDLVINDSATIDLDSDITVNNDMLINSGTFYLQGFTVDVAEDVEISGELRMTDSVDVLDVGDEIVWQTGSSDNITAGNIYAPFWIFDNGTNAQLGTGNTVHISNTLYCYDADASFGNLECGQFSRIGFDRNRTPQPIRVSGDYSLTAGASWTTNVDIIVNGIVDIENGASLTVNNSSTLETDSAFSLNGDLDLSATGNALVHGNFELESTAELTIAGGDFICDTPYTGYTWLRGTFNISDGLFEVTNNSLNFTSTSIDNISGGTIQVGRTFNASSSGVFQPSGGSVIIAVENASDNIVCINGNYFHDLVIEDNISLNYDLIINNDLIINSGYLNLYNHTLDVGNNVEIYGELQMVSIPDILNIGNDIFWYSGSSELVSNGTINVYGDWIFESGTTARLGYGNTVYFKGNNNSIIRCDDDDAEFGDIIIDKPVTRGATYIHSSSAETMRVVGDLTVNTGNFFHVWHQDLIIEGTLDIEDTALMDLISGSLTSNSNFELDGQLDIGSGNVLINGTFDLDNTGILTIDGGDFISTDRVTSQDMKGTLNLSDGLYQSNEGIYIFPTATMNISGGTINTTSLIVQSGATFQPSGGTLEITRDDAGNGGILCSDGNYLHNYMLDAPLGGSILQADLLIKNDLEILTGTLTGNNFDIYIEGDWTNNVGDAGFQEIGTMVTFSGDYNAQILMEEIFYDLTLEKTSSRGDILEIPAGQNLSVTHDLNINDGTFDVNNNCVLNIGNELNINNEGTLDITCSTGNEALITKMYGPHYDFNIETGGTIKAQNAVFEYMTGNGVYVKSGATINPLLPFHNCLFRNGDTSGSLLTVDNDQTLTINDVEFLSGDALYNVTKTVDAGEITFENAVGTFAGEDFDNDIYYRINWTYVYPDLEITNVACSETNPYVCDEITVDVTITNNGNVASSICVLDFYNNLGSPPPVGEIGDKRSFVNSIPAFGFEVITLYQIWNDIDETWNSYFQIDTGNSITESDEDNNIWGPENLTWNPLPVIDDLSIQIDSDDVELSWTYPISYDSFNIYKSLDPYDFSEATVEISPAFNYSEPVSGTMYYYRVTAVRNCVEPGREVGISK